VSFTLAALIIVALVAAALGLVAYNLLQRLDQLEQSVLGGLTPPSRRLSREEFEQRFETATARSALAAQIETGVVLIFGPEMDSSPIARAVDHLSRADLLTVVLTNDSSSTASLLEVPGITVTHDTDAAVHLRASTTPFVFVVDDQRITLARPIASADDLVSVLRSHT
jgi:hypothetical protein